MTNPKQVFKKEFKELEAAFAEIEEKVPELKLSAIKIKDAAMASWQVEDAARNRLFIVLTGAGADGPDEAEAIPTDLVLTVEAEVGQLLDFDAEALKAFLEMNYSKLNLCRVALTPDGRVAVLHRRWLEGLSCKDAFDAIAEVWNAAESLRGSMQPRTPGHA